MAWYLRIVTVLAPRAESAILTPPLKWAGGKRWLVPTLRPLLSAGGNRRLVEPFAGGLGVALGLQPEQALLNDANEHLINFYTWVQAGLVIELEFSNESDDYYAARKRFNGLIQAGKHTTKVAAELFYYLNRTGYNGLCRFNRKGEFNVPYGRYKRINYATGFLEYKDTFRDWKFQTGDYKAVRVAEEDIVYADPPYDVEFTAYSKDPFGWKEQVELADWLRSLPAPVIASNQATDRIIELYAKRGFAIQTLDAPRRISCNGDRTPAREILATLRL